MRVTQTMLSDTVTRNINANLARMQRFQDQLSSGKRVNRPSDDPVAVSIALRLDSASARNTQYLRNIDDGQAWLDSSDGALNSVGQALQRARELAIQGANESLSATDRGAIAQELRGLLDHAVAAGNTTLAGQSLFAGQRTLTPAFDGAFIPPVYQGDGGAILRTVGDGLDAQVNVVGGTDLQPALNALATLYNAALANNPAGLRAGIATLDSAHDVLITAHTRIGAVTNNLEAQRERLLSVQVDVAKQRSQEIDVDMTEAISNYANQELVYRAALQAGARAIQPSLLDYLR